MRTTLLNRRAWVMLAGAVCVLAALAVETRAETKAEKQKRQREELMEEVKESRELFLKADKDLKKFFDTSAGFVVFPKIAKGAVGVGAAHGSGIAFAKGKAVGDAKVTQVTIGFQLGGQVYSEVIFLETEGALKDFQEGNFKFSAQVSAVAAAEGVSRNAKYDQGVLVFTMAGTGLMYEASVGGQKFSYQAFEKGK